MAGGSFATSPRIPRYLRVEQEKIEKMAVQYGLEYFPVIFEMVTYDQMNEIAAYGGFPNRYPHWRFGMEYERLAKSTEYGLSKIYELVINNNPSVAYLLEGHVGCEVTIDGDDDFTRLQPGAGGRRVADQFRDEELAVAFIDPDADPAIALALRPLVTSALGAGVGRACALASPSERTRKDRKGEVYIEDRWSELASPPSTSMAWRSARLSKTRTLALARYLCASPR